MQTTQLCWTNFSLLIDSVYLLSVKKVFDSDKSNMVAQSVSLQHELDTFDDGRSVNTKKIAQCCASVAPTKSICA
jgi:hypothetical protein